MTAGSSGEAVQDETSTEPRPGRTATTAADTWGKTPMDEDTALTLVEQLRGQGYNVRLCVEASHPDSSVVKTIDNQSDADATLANLKLEEEYPKEG